MYGHLTGDECPSCGARQMPTLDPGSLATARACQACLFVQELDPGTGTPVLSAKAIPPVKAGDPERRIRRYVGGMHADH